MKFYKLKLFSLLLCGAMVSFVACNKEELVKATQPEAEEITLANGRLKFSSQKVFDQTMIELSKQQTPEELNKWEGQWQGFVSMRTAFDKITEQDIVKIATSGTKGYDGYLTLVGEGEEKEVVRNIDSQVLATLVNKDGVVLIGDKAFKFNYNSLIRVSDYTDTKLSKLEQITQENKAEGIEVLSVERSIIGSRSQKSPSGREVNCISEYWHGGTLCCKKRFVGEIWGTIYSDASFTAYGGRSKHQRRSSGIWYADATDQLRLVINVVGSGLNYDNTKYGDNIIEWSYIPVDSNGNGVHFFLDSLTGYHSGVCDDGRFRECSNSYF